MRYLTLAEVVDLHGRLLQATGGAPGIRDLGALESAMAQPKATFGSADLYPTLAEKATALCISLVLGHPFVDGNKRVAQHFRPLARAAPPVLAVRQVLALRPPVQALACLTR
jgi:prophage maintenance system killer protein